MSQLLDLQVEIASRLPDSSETATPITLHCAALQLHYDEGMFSYPLTKKERDDLSWYLEDYWKWPFGGFAQRGSAIEQLLPALGQRLYQATFRQGAARDIIQQWQANSSGTHQISIITTDAGYLSLPWELLHNGQDFLALQTNPPISIARRIAEEQQTSLRPEAIIEKPLRVLLVTARPVDEGQVDVRTIAREVVDALQEQRETGAIELEFLRPPTFDNLVERLSERERPIHILHFDGHGEFRRFSRSQDGNTEEEGRLFFEKEDGKKDSVDAASLAEMLHYGGVKVAVLNACKSAAIGERDSYGSVAIQLLKGGLQAVVAMSASIQTTTAALYVKAFYRALAAGGPIQAAHRQAQRVLHDHLERNLLQHRLDEARKPVNLQDWWLPYLYVQRSLALQPVREETQSRQLVFTPTALRPNSTSPASSTYEFTGRSAELLQIERSLLRNRIVIISGFGGIGKTALACEVADWLTRTKMYDSVCFISFEHGGDASVLLSTLGNVLAINDGSYHAYDPPAALAILAPLLKKQHVLIIVDNVESILPGGDAVLDDVERDQLWETLVQLRNNGAGVLITSRSPKLDDQRFAPGIQADYRELKGLAPDDAYTLAMQVMNAIRIDRAHAPYVDLCDLLALLDNHPLAIRLTLPALQSLPLAKVQADFASLLPTFQDDQATGRNRSLLASLDYSLCRLSETERSLLPHLALFEGGTSEDNLLAITEIPESDWVELHRTLVQAALLTAERVEDFDAPFLHFHPILAPYLRGLAGADNANLRTGYADCYYKLANYLFNEDTLHPQSARALVRRELPNLKRALAILLEVGELDAAVDMADSIARFLNSFGLRRELDEMRKQVREALETVKDQRSGTLTLEQCMHESGLGEDEYRRGNVQAAYDRFSGLLAQIEAQSDGTPSGRGSYAHCLILSWLARCLKSNEQATIAERRLREALILIETLIEQKPDEQTYKRHRMQLLTELGDILCDLGRYPEARETYGMSLKFAEQQGDLRGQVAVLAQLGYLELEQRNYAEAWQHYRLTQKHFRTLGEPETEATIWYQLGMIAEEQEQWEQAEQSYRESLVIEEQLGNAADVADVCNQLGLVAVGAGRYKEAEGWYRRALELYKQIKSGSPEHSYVLGNLADLLINEAQRQQASNGLVEAKSYADQALAMQETLDASVGIWNTLNILARIAELERRAEEAHKYRLREQETFAAFDGNRYHIDHEHKSLISDIAEATREGKQRQKQVEAALSELEADGWHIAVAIQRIWVGERDWHSLTEGLDGPNALFILRVLEMLMETDEVEKSG